jgi:hypothetical protein
MPTTWDQLGTMTANQIAKAKQFETIGRQRTSGTGENPDISMVTVGQSKTAQNFLHGANELVTATLVGADYVREKNAKDAAQAADDAHPPE